MPPYQVEQTSPALPVEAHPASIRAYLALAGGVGCIGFSAIFVKKAATYGDVVAFYRMAIGALVLSPLVLANWRRGSMRLPRGAIWMGLLAGVFFSLDLVTWHTAIMRGTAGMATLLANTAPVWVGLGAWLIFRERLRPTYWLGLFVALGGVVLIMGLDALRGAGFGGGNLLAIAAAIAYACYLLLTQPARARIDNLSYLWLFSLTSAILFLILSLTLGHPLIGLPRQSYLSLIGLGVFSHVGGWLLINYAFGRLRASLVSVTLLGQPLVTTLVAMPVLGEIPTLWHVAGGLITLAGIYLVHRSASE